MGRSNYCNIEESCWLPKENPVGAAARIASPSLGPFRAPPQSPSRVALRAIPSVAFAPLTSPAGLLASRRLTAVPTAVARPPWLACSPRLPARRCRRRAERLGLTPAWRRTARRLAPCTPRPARHGTRPATLAPALRHAGAWPLRAWRRLPPPLLPRCPHPPCHSPAVAGFGAGGLLGAVASPRIPPGSGLPATASVPSGMMEQPYRRIVPVAQRIGTMPLIPKARWACSELRKRELGTCGKIGFFLIPDRWFLGSPGGQVFGLFFPGKTSSRNRQMGELF